jgi:hypothetical protein
MVCKNHKVHIYKELLVNRLQKSSCNFPALSCNEPDLMRHEIGGSWTLFQNFRLKKLTSKKMFQETDG